MFLSRKYRDRAVGLVAAYTLLIGGVVASTTFDRAPAKVASKEVASNVAVQMHATEASLDLSKTKMKKADDCLSALECRTEFYC